MISSYVIDHIVNYKSRQFYTWTVMYLGVMKKGLARH